MDDLNVDPVFVGLTRPTTLFGVQFEAFAVYFICISILFIIVKSLLVFVLILPVHGFCFVMNLKDPRIFELLGLRIQFMSRCDNQIFWKCNSYSPLEFNHKT